MFNILRTHVEVEGYFVQPKPQMSSLVLSTCFPISPRESEKKNKEQYEKLPLFVIEEKYGKTEGGRTVVALLFPP